MFHSVHGRWLARTTGLLAALVLTSSSVSGQVVDQLGDDDCFGISGVVSCPDGSLFRDGLGGAFFTDYRSVGDPAFTDIWANPGSVSWTHAYAIPAGIVGGLLEFRVAGLADAPFTAQSYSVFFNGFLAGTILNNTSSDAFQEVRTISLGLNAAWFTGSDLVSFTTQGGDGFILDYARLSVNSGGSTVPEPATMTLLATGLAGMAAARRKKSRG